VRVGCCRTTPRHDQLQRFMWGRCGVLTPQRVSKTEEIGPGIMQRGTESTGSSQGFLEISRPPGL